MIHRTVPQIVRFDISARQHHIFTKRSEVWPISSIASFLSKRTASLKVVKAFFGTMHTSRTRSSSPSSRSPSRYQSSSSPDSIGSDFFQTLKKSDTNLDLDSQLSTACEDQFVVCVEGNIGCGKTTLLNYFENMGGCEVIAEPVNKWRCVGDYNPLAMMYANPSRWAMTLQTYVQLTMLQIHTKPLSHKVRLMERSIFSAKYCFVDNLFKSGIMHEMDYIILSKWFDWIIQAQKIKVDLFVYLRTDPEQLHRRIMKRCRKEEENIPLEYLKTLHQCHEDWLVQKKIPCPADVLVLDANTSLEQMKLIYEEHKYSILNARLQEAQQL